MADWYNLSAITGSDPLELIQTVDANLFFHYFGVMLLLTLFVIIFRSTMYFNNNPKLNFVYTSFFIFILSVPLRLLSLVTDSVVFITLGILCLSIVGYFLIDSG